MSVSCSRCFPEASEKKKKYINKDSIPVYVQFTAGLEQLNMEIIFGLFGIFQSGTTVEDPRVNNA